MIRIITTVIVAVASLNGTSAIARGAAPSEAPTRTISYADLNLASPAGAAVLRHRIDAAITTVCGIADPMELDRSAIINACRAKAKDGAQTEFAMATTRAEAKAMRLAAVSVASR